MNTYLLDTNHAGAVLRRLPKPRDRILASPADRFFLCRPSIGELWYMVFNSARIADNEKELRQLLADFTLVEYDETAAIEFGRIKAELRRIGRPIPDVDTQIAAIARARGLVVLTADAHFSVVPGIKTENWLT